MSPFDIIKSMFNSAPRPALDECCARVRRNEAVLVDVREPGEWSSGVAESALLLPLSDLTGPRLQWRPILDGSADREFLVYCVSGGRLAIAARILVSEGFRAANAGGLADWTAAGWPVTKPS